MKTITHQDKTFCYKTVGNKNHPCLVLVMGITGQLINWPDTLLQGLADSGFYVLIFDNRDVGLSQYYDHLPTPSLGEVMAQLQQGQPVTPPYTLQDMAEDIVTLLDVLDITQAHIAGVSMGGQVAQYFALAHPEKTLSLALISTSSGDRDLPPPSQAVMEFFFNGKPPVNQQEAIERHVAQYKLYNHPDDFNPEGARVLQEKAHERAYHPQGNHRQLLAMICAQPRGEALKVLNVPTVIVHGDCDPVFNLEHAKRLQSCIAGSRLEVIKNLGHGLPRRMHPELIAVLKNAL